MKWQQTDKPTKNKTKKTKIKNDVQKKYGIFLTVDYLLSTFAEYHALQ